MRHVAPPSGEGPPASLRLRSGETIALAPLAAAAGDRHLAAHPEELERYGRHARAWCAHDLQWVLLWALMDADGQALDLDPQLDWLARVLDARGYPLESLADGLLTLAELIEPARAEAASRLRSGAARVRPDA